MTNLFEVTYSTNLTSEGKDESSNDIELNFDYKDLTSDSSDDQDDKDTCTFKDLIDTLVKDFIPEDNSTTAVSPFNFPSKYDTNANDFNDFAIEGFNNDNYLFSSFNKIKISDCLASNKKNLFNKILLFKGIQKQKIVNFLNLKNFSNSSNNVSAAFNTNSNI